MYGEDPKSLSDDDKKRKLHSIQMEIVIHEADIRKMANKKVELEAELRKIHMDQERLRVTFEEKRVETDRATRDLADQEEELRHLKKEQNFLI